MPRCRSLSLCYNYTSAPLMQGTHCIESDSPFCCYAPSTNLQIEMAAIFGESPLQLCTASTPELSNTYNSDSQHNSEVATLGSVGSTPGVGVSDSSIDTFTIVFDNLDKYVKSFDMRMDHQSKSVHFVNAIAVLDRIDSSHLPCKLTPKRQELDMKKLLPDKNDFELMKKNFAVHVSRLLVDYIPCLSQCKAYVKRHIPHKYSKEMSMKSTVVSKTHLYYK